MPTHLHMAIKTLEKDSIILKRMQEKTIREIRIMEKLRHPHVVRVYESIITTKTINVVMELVSGGELYSLLFKEGRLYEPMARHYFQQLISAIEYIHNNSFTHRDLKPENILLDENKNLKVTDFGLSNKMCDGRFLLTACGSPNYAAPEVVSGRPYCGSEVDVWGSGVVLYALLVGQLPFNDENTPSLYRKICSGAYSIPGFVNPSARDLISRMIKPSQIDRITIPEIKKHPWYLNDLPMYLALMDNAREEGIIKEIDTDALKSTMDVNFICVLINV